NRNARARIGLGKGNVEAHHAGLVTSEELMQHQRQLVATPGPVSLGVDTALVDVDDYDARVARSGQEQAHSLIVGPTLELGERTEFHPARSVDEQARNQGESD